MACRCDTYGYWNIRENCSDWGMVCRNGACVFDTGNLPTPTPLPLTCTGAIGGYCCGGADSTSEVVVDASCEAQGSPYCCIRKSSLVTPGVATPTPASTLYSCNEYGSDAYCCSVEWGGTYFIRGTSCANANYLGCCVPRESFSGGGSTPTALPTFLATPSPVPTTIPTLTRVPTAALTTIPTSPSVTRTITWIYASSTPSPLPSPTEALTWISLAPLPTNTIFTPTKKPTPTAGPTLAPIPPDLSAFCNGDPSYVKTALGCLPTSMSLLGQILLPYVFGIVGGISFLRAVYGFVMIAFSAGDPKVIDENKQIITSAVVGLLVTIFSLVIMRLILVGILKLPGIE